jgi:hypothetical protein
MIPVNGALAVAVLISGNGCREPLHVALAVSTCTVSALIRHWR